MVNSMIVGIFGYRSSAPAMKRTGAARRRVAHRSSAPLSSAPQQPAVRIPQRNMYIRARTVQIEHNQSSQSLLTPLKNSLSTISHSFTSLRSIPFLSMINHFFPSPEITFHTPGTSRHCEWVGRYNCHVGAIVWRSSPSAANLASAA